LTTQEEAVLDRRLWWMFHRLSPILIQVSFSVHKRLGCFVDDILLR
jgi:hypothetical protein